VQITGGGTVRELGRTEEVLQPAEEHEMWQDSVVLCWWDLERGVGGYHRIGHHRYHADGPQVHLTNNFFGPDCVYKRCEFIPLRPEDQGESTYGCGDGTCSFEFTDHAIWRFDQPEVSGELHVYDSHPPVDIYPKTGQLAERITAGHLEVGATVTGSLTLNGSHYEVDGLAFRDHGWGKRYWEDFVAHRWIAGTFGPDLTVLAVSVLGTDDEIAEFGCVIRDDTLTYADEVEIVPYFEPDALTHNGGRARLQMPGGEVMEIDIVPLQKGVVSWMPGQMSVTDTMSKMTSGDRVGVCNFEISNNASRGRFRARFATMGFTEDGLHLL
jgi:hypothetical protein